MRAFISFGSNLGDRLAHLSEAKRRLASTGHVAILAASPVYESAPVDCPPQTPSFYNAVVVVDTELTPHLLLDALQQIEAAMGRPPTRPKKTPRAIDLDLLLCGEEVICDDRLQLPHPLLAQRRFVLQPLTDLDPDFELPILGTTARARLADLTDAQWVRKVSEQW